MSFRRIGMAAIIVIGVGCREVHPPEPSRKVESQVPKNSPIPDYHEVGDTWAKFIAGCLLQCRIDAGCKETYVDLIIENCSLPSQCRERCLLEAQNKFHGGPPR